MKKDITMFIFGLVIGVCVTLTAVAIKYIDTRLSATPQQDRIELLDYQMRDFESRLDMLLEKEREELEKMRGENDNN